MGGFRGQKMFFKLAEISLIISSKVENFLVLAVLRKTFSIGKKSNFKFQNREKKKSHQVAGTFFEKKNPRR